MAKFNEWRGARRGDGNADKLAFLGTSFPAAHSTAGVPTQAVFQGWLILILAAMFVSSARGQAVPPDPAATNAAALYKKMSLEQLMNLDVTSVSKEPEPYRNAPAAIEVITGDEIRRSGASSIPEALRLADNLEVAQVSSSVWDISARGFNSSVSDKLLVMMDGRSLYTPLFAGVIWNMQDYLLADIDRIEVVSGPGGTLWGANAVNGVINITTKSAKDTQGLYVEAGGGSQLEDFTAVRYGGMLASNVYYRVYGKYFDQGSEVFADGASAHDSWNRGQAGFRIDSEASAQNPLTLQGDFYAGGTDVLPGGEGNPPAEGHAWGGNLLSRWTHLFSDDNQMSLQVYYDRTHLAAPFSGAPAEPAFPPLFPASGPIPGGTLKDDLDTIDVDFQDRFQLGARNHVVWGLGYRFTHDVVANTPIVTFLPGILDQDLFSGFVQDEIKLLEKVHLTIGSKLEHNDYTGFEYEPSARLQWDVTDQQMLWAAVSRSVRMPSRYDENLYQPAPNYQYIYHLTGNPAFESEKVIAYELGYRAQVTPKVSGSISAFYNDYDDLRSSSEKITLNNPASLIDVYFQNNLEGHTYGFELSADYQVFSWWRLHAGYDLLKEDIHTKPGTTDVDHALGETADPENQVFLRSSMDLPGRTELDVGARWIDTVRNNNGSVAGTVPSYFELDVRLGWHVTRNLEVAIVGQNLLHDQHVEAGFAGPAQEFIERSVYGKVSYSW
jgi:iron complex outermembrane receptor protein